MAKAMQIEYDGRTQSLSAWAREVGISKAMLSQRINKLGWPIEKALTKGTLYENNTKGKEDMGYHGEYRNSSGYLDPTASCGLSAANARPGEIWCKRYYDEEYLILKNHGEFCTTLKLLDEEVSGGVEIISREKRYTNPAMVGYTYNTVFGDFVKQMRDAEFAAVLKAVETAIKIPVVDVFNEEHADLEQKVAMLEQDRKALVDQNDSLRECLAKTEEELEFAKQRLAAVQGMGNSGKLEHKLELLREMYNDLLNKVIEGGRD